jgi:VanZ family protein
MKIKWFSTIWPALLWSTLIFILLIIPGKEMPAGPQIPSFDKIIHSFLFGLQVWLWCMYFKKTEKFYNRLNIFFFIFFLSSIYGIGMEYVQKYFVANRAFELGDIIADIVGSAMGALIALKSK